MSQAGPDGRSTAHSDRHGRSRATTLLVMTLVVTAGLSTRLLGIGGSLWIDEFSTLWVVEGPLSEVAPRVQSFHGQAPLYYYAVWAATRLIGESELALRLPSLVASLVTAVACGWAAYELATYRAGLLAFSFAWLLFPSVQAAVNARPYALAISGIALGIAGYVRAARVGTLPGRALVVLGTVLAFWAHFLLVAPIVALLAIHVAWVSDRTEYTRRAAVFDAAIALALCLPAWPWIAAALSREQHVRWLASPQHLDAVLLIVALLVPWFIGRAPTAVLGRTITRVLLGSILVTFIGFELGQVAGVQLVTARYLWPIIVPAAVVAAVRASTLRGGDLAAALIAFGLITAGTHLKAFIATGSASGIGVEDWRSATTALRHRTAGAPLLVLFRSGFVEEDAEPLGRTPPATRAAVRSPGENAPLWELIPLTYRWDNPARAHYFTAVVAPALVRRSEFALLCQRTVEPGGSYAEHVTTWIHSTFPGGFSSESLSDARGVDVVLFRRSAGIGQRDPFITEGARSGLPPSPTAEPNPTAPGDAEITR